MNARPEVLLQFAGQLRHTRQLVLFLSLSLPFQPPARCRQGRRGSSPASWPASPGRPPTSARLRKVNPALVVGPPTAHRRPTGGPLAALCQPSASPKPDKLDNQLSEATLISLQTRSERFCFPNSKAKTSTSSEAANRSGIGAVVVLVGRRCADEPDWRPLEAHRGVPGADSSLGGHGASVDGHHDDHCQQTNKTLGSTSGRHAQRDGQTIVLALQLLQAPKKQ